MKTTFERLLPLARTGATWHVKRTARWGVHGVGHWRNVAQNGRLLAALTPGCDVEVVEAFAALHDSQRRGDGGDRYHGLRASVVAARLHTNGKLGLTDEQALLVVRACRLHTGSGPVKDPTVGVCFDADRLDIGRVGTRVERRYLSTRAAKRAA
jgi:uncharacterized protein